MLPAVRDLALRLGADRDVRNAMIRLKQSGRMQQPGGAWRSFRASQSIDTARCAFDWRARTGPGGLLSVRDALTADGARLEVRLLGFRVDGAGGSAALWRGELMRYLAELAWAPDAILHNHALRWRTDGPDRFIVGAGQGDTETEIMLDLGSDGRIAGAFAPDRPRSPKPPFLPTPWQGRFTDYCRHGTRWLPFAAEVGWVIDGVEAIYWQGRLDKWTIEAATDRINS